MYFKFLILLLVSWLGTTAIKSAVLSSSYDGIQLVDSELNPITDWVTNNQGFIIQLIGAEQSPQISEVSAQEFQIFADETDITALFEYRNHQLIFSGGTSIPPGELSIEVFQADGENWISIGRETIKLMTASGVKRAEWNTSLSVTVDSQLDERVSGDATPSERPTYSDVTSALGITTDHEINDTTINSQFNLLSVSNRQQAIQFGQRFEQAAKLDLSDYQVNIKQGNHDIVLGHTSYGSNSLIVDNLSRRGLSWIYRDDDELEFNGALLSGSDIVGYRNITGLSDYSEQHIKALGVGMNFFEESAYRVRLEATYMDGQRQALNDFGIGEIASPETNKALGLKFILSDDIGHLNADLTIAASRYNNPNDVGFDLSDQLVELSIETAHAHQLNLSYQLLDNIETVVGNTSVSLTASHTRAEPLYQTLTAFVQANVRSAAVAAQYQVGLINGQLNSTESRDNLANLASLLTTQSESDGLSINIPLADMTRDDDEDSSSISIWPSVDYSFQASHQYALNSPEQNISGFNNSSHLPDQKTTNHSMSLGWQLNDYNLSMQSSYGLQDNRQVGRENADYNNLQHAINLYIQQSNTTSWAIGLSKNRQFDQLNQKALYSDSINVTYSWVSDTGWSVNLNYGLSEDDDSNNESTNTATTANLAISKDIDGSSWQLPLSGSMTLSVNYNDSEFEDNLFDLFNQFGTTTIQLGISLNIL